MKRVEIRFVDGGLLNYYAREVAIEFRKNFCEIFWGMYSQKYCNDSIKSIVVYE